MFNAEVQRFFNNGVSVFKCAHSGNEYPVNSTRAIHLKKPLITVRQV